MVDVDARTVEGLRYALAILRNEESFDRDGWLGRRFKAEAALERLIEQHDQAGDDE